MQDHPTHRGQTVRPLRTRVPLRTLLLLIGMGLMLPCYLFTVGNVCLSPWPLYERSHAALVLLTALCTAGLLLALRAVWRHEAFFARHERRLLIGFALFYFAVQMAMGAALRFTPRTDLEQCYTAAQLLVDTGSYGQNERSYLYFTRYPFNLGLVYLMAGIFRLFGALGLSDRFMQLVLVNSLLFTCGLLAGARVVRRLGGACAQARFLILTASCLPMLYCTTEIYTDSFSLAFPLMIAYAALRIRDAQDARHAAPWAAAFALLTLIGSQIRFTTVIAAIACLIALVLSRNPLRGIAALCVLLPVMLAGSALVDAENAKHIAPEEMAALEFSPLHHIAMGLPIHEDEGYGQYGDGGWYIFSTSFDDPDERNAALLTEIIDRVYYLRYPNRLINMMSRKNLSTFGDGTFTLSEIIEADAPEPDSPVKAVIFRQGRFFGAYYHLCTALFMAQMLLACLSCAQAIRRRDADGAALYITLLGAFLFLSIWETRGRYFFQFEMVLLAAAALLRTRQPSPTPSAAR